MKELQAEVFRCTERMQLLSREKDEVSCCLVALLDVFTCMVYYVRIVC